jgi:hypothetical protein
MQMKLKIQNQDAESYWDSIVEVRWYLFIFGLVGSIFLIISSRFYDNIYFFSLFGGIILGVVNMLNKLINKSVGYFVGALVIIFMVALSGVIEYSARDIYMTLNFISPLAITTSIFAMIFRWRLRRRTRDKL